MLFWVYTCQNATLLEIYFSAHMLLSIMTDYVPYFIDADGPVRLELPNQWLWDIIDEFIYQVCEVKVLRKYCVTSLFLCFCYIKTDSRPTRFFMLIGSKILF